MISTKRLIDANILKTLFDVRYDTAFIQERTRDNKEQWNGYCTGINWGRNTIANAPTVDAVEVPCRCKECRYSVQDHPYDPMECMKWKTKWGVAYTTPDGYCHKGERKTNDKN